MPIILGILVLIAIGGTAVGLAKAQNRPVRHGGRTSARSGGGSRPGGRASPGRGRGGSSARPSWWLKAWNASGAPKTTETTLSGAAAVVTGKAAGRVARGGAWVSRRFGRGGAWAAKRIFAPAGRWLDRTHAALTAAAGTGLTCAGCGGAIAPGEKHVTVNRHVEAMRRGAVDVHDAETLVAYHPQCEPKGAFAGHEPATATGPEPGMSWREYYDRERKYRRYVELRRLAGTPLTPAQLVNEVDVDRDVADELAKSWDEKFQREHPTDNEIKPTAPPSVFIHPDRPTEGAHVDTTTRPLFNRATVPPTLVAHLDHIAQFDPDTDDELLNMLGAEVQGALAYAEALGQMFENCVTGKGLDPAAMQGVNDYADAHTENAERVANAHRQFLAVYEAIIEAANNGTQMPYNGRFFSGNAA